MSEGSTEQRVETKDLGWSTVIAVLALCVGLIAAGLGLIGATRTVSASSATDSGGPASNVTEASVTLQDISVAPAELSIAKGKVITLHVKNVGPSVHDLLLDGKTGTKRLDAGKSETIEVGPFDADATLWCTVPGHKAAGMTLTLHVGTAASNANASMAAMTGSGSSDDAKIDANAKPAADWKPFDPALSPAPGGTTHTLTMHAIEKVIEVAPGVTQQMWTFNGQVPGPILRGKVGDLFNVTLVNDGKVEHSIDFHASKVAWNDKMRSIKPGEHLIYQYQAKFAGVFMYHCGTAPALHHIGNGMYGMVIIDPPTLAPVDHEYAIVQSELYLGPQGQPGDLTKMQNEQHDAVVFNGYFNQYKFHPIRVEPGQRVRVFVLDAGPSENSAFHIVGTIFDTVYKEGTYLLQPDTRRGGSQVLDLQPAQGGFVEFSFDEKGLYPIVTHKFANVGKGALGLFQAGDVVMPAGAGH